MVDKSQQLKEFGQQITALQRQLYLYILTLVAQPADAEDILQETNRVAWEKADEYKPDTNFSAWAYRIAYFEVRTFRKRTARETLRFDDTVFEQLADEATRAVDESIDRRHALRHCMSELSDDDRDLISRRYLEGATAADVARQVDRSAKSVCQSMARIRRKLLACIERYLAREERS